MKRELISIIACSRCKSPLRLEKGRQRKNRIVSGKLMCEECGAVFEIIDEIICFKPITRRDKNKVRLRKIQNLFLGQELKKDWLKNFTEQEIATVRDEWSWMINHLNLKKSKIHLDWATGMGRFLRNILEVVKGEIAALEIDYATCLGLKTFLEKIGKYSNVTIIYGDARMMPFADNSIESVSSWGGLNEPNIKKALDESKRVLKTGRALAVSGEFYEEGSRSLKKAKKARIEFAKENEALQYFKRLGFKNINYKTFFKAKKLDRRDFLPCFGDYYTAYAIAGRK